MSLLGIYPGLLNLIGAVCAGGFICFVIFGVTALLGALAAPLED